MVRTVTHCCGYASCATFLFLPHFDVICDLLLNRRTATWNLFVKYIYFIILKEHSRSRPFLAFPRPKMREGVRTQVKLGTRLTPDCRDLSFTFIYCLLVSSVFPVNQIYVISRISVNLFLNNKLHIHTVYQD